MELELGYDLGGQQPVGGVGATGAVWVEVRLQCHGCDHSECK